MSRRVFDERCGAVESAERSINSVEGAAACFNVLIS